MFLPGSVGSLHFHYLARLSSRCSSSLCDAGRMSDKTGDARLWSLTITPRHGS
jgi:hypothetical protein